MQPDQLLLISPITSCDITGQVNSRMARIEPGDWWLSRGALASVCNHWVGPATLQESVLERFSSHEKRTSTAANQWKSLLPTSGDHPLLTPIHYAEPFEILRNADVKVTILGATNDVLYAHAAMYAQRCQEAGVSCTFIEGVGGIHDYPLLAYITGDAGCLEGVDLMTSCLLKASRL